MFEKFGEFNSAEELNRKAEELKGDIYKLKQFAAENGLEKDDVNDYVDGVITELATPLTAAMGKIKAEKEENVIFGGRLGEYKYYDMDKVIASAMVRAKEIFGA